jgi:hypothetical protein
MRRQVQKAPTLLMVICNFTFELVLIWPPHPKCRPLTVSEAVSDHSVGSAPLKLHFLGFQSQPEESKNPSCSYSVLEKKPTHWTIQLVLPERTYLLRCSDPDKIDVWLTAFQTVFSFSDPSAAALQPHAPSAPTDNAALSKPLHEHDSERATLNGDSPTVTDSDPPWLHRERSEKNQHRELVPRHVTADIGILSPKAPPSAELPGPAAASGPAAGPRGPSPSLGGGPPHEQLVDRGARKASLPLTVSKSPVPAAQAALAPAASEVAAAAAAQGRDDGPAKSVGLVAQVSPDSEPCAAASPEPRSSGGSPERGRGGSRPRASQPEHQLRDQQPVAVPRLDFSAAALFRQPQPLSSPSRSRPREPVSFGPDGQAGSWGWPGSDRQDAGAVTPRAAHRGGTSGDGWVPAQRIAEEEAWAAGREDGGSRWSGSGWAAHPPPGSGYVTPRGAGAGMVGDGASSGSMTPRQAPLSPRVVLPVPVLRAELVQSREREEAQEIVTPRGTSFFRAATKISPRHYKSFLARKFLQPDSDQGDRDGAYAVVPDGAYPDDPLAVYRLAL